jgi:hypothetical protein
VGKNPNFCSENKEEARGFPMPKKGETTSAALNLRLRKGAQWEDAVLVVTGWALDAPRYRCQMQGGGEVEKAFAIRNKWSEMRFSHHRCHHTTTMQPSSSSNLFTMLFVILFLLGGLWFEQCAGQCSSTSPLVGFTADFTMVQHQLRGTLRIVDDCSFTVRVLFLALSAPPAPLAPKHPDLIR